MESIRQKQIAELIRRNFSTVLSEEGKYIYGQKVLVTVTTVKMSSDLQLAKIYLSIYNTENKQEPILELEEQYHRLKQSLYSKIKKQMRVMPEFKLYLDDTLDEVYKMDDLFKKINQQSNPFDLKA
ncbi:MAG: 30S ribosome-binding factor RbfA [Saprospiraceae bacterium]|nr:30S ribosome-binding factor RbfA [Saprospiraceae bacterium]